MSARDDIAAYLLGELSGPERDAFERSAAQDAALREEIERLRPVVTRLQGLSPAAWATEPAAPALRRARRDRGPRRGGRDRRPDRRRGRRSAGGARTLALAPVDDPGSSARGEASVGRSTATVDLSGLPPSADDQFYELWLLNSADDLVSLASFRVPASGKASVTVPVPGGAGDYRFVDVSVEPRDGDPAHSGDSVLRGRIPDA